MRGGCARSAMVGSLDLGSQAAMPAVIGLPVFYVALVLFVSMGGFGNVHGVVLRIWPARVMLERVPMAAEAGAPRRKLTKSVATEAPAEDALEQCSDDLKATALGRATEASWVPMTDANEAHCHPPYEAAIKGCSTDCRLAYEDFHLQPNS